MILLLLVSIYKYVNSLRNIQPDGKSSSERCLL